MNVLSYRGPGKAGGVSGALARVIENTGDSSIRWFYLEESDLKCRAQEKCISIYGLPNLIVEGHYRYCNNFLWPVLHDMPERALYNPGDRLCYGQFNRLIILNILGSLGKTLTHRFFVQDYQLSLVPSFLDQASQATSSIFWHIPWPRYVERAHLEALVEVAEGLLASRKIGFHIEEYALNFLNFVRVYLPQFEVDFDSRQVFAIKQKLFYPDNVLPTQVVVSPIGLDIHFWSKNAFMHKPTGLDETIRLVCSNPYILSVDRADYTKGILQRIQAINHLFELRPELIGNLSFLQVCQPSRIGLPQFDKYWQQTQKAAQELNSLWQREKWQPLVWLTEPIQPNDLAWLYANADAMLVSPLRDGLNLTAKEFIACTRREDSILLLSPGAGVWQEVGDLAITVNAHTPIIAAQQIARSLILPRKEKTRRMLGLKRRVEENPLHFWWEHLTQEVTLQEATGLRLGGYPAESIVRLEQDYDESKVL